MIGQNSENKRLCHAQLQLVIYIIYSTQFLHLRHKEYHRIGARQIIRARNQENFYDILSLRNYREALPMTTFSLWLFKQDLNNNTTNKYANVEEKYQEVSRERNTDN